MSASPPPANNSESVLPVPSSSMAADAASNRQQPVPGAEQPASSNGQPASAFDTTSLHEMLTLADIKPNPQSEERFTLSGFPRSILSQYIDQSRHMVDAQRVHTERLQAAFDKQEELLVTERKTAALERALMKHERELVVAERSMWTEERLNLYHRVWDLEQAELQRAPASQNERPMSISRPRPGQIGAEWTERFVGNAYRTRPTPDAPTGPSLSRTVHGIYNQAPNPPTSRPPTSCPPTTRPLTTHPPTTRPPTSCPPITRSPFTFAPIQPGPIGPSPLRNVSRPNDQESSLPASQPMVMLPKRPTVFVEEVRRSGTTRRRELPLDFIPQDFGNYGINPNVLARNFLPDRPAAGNPEQRPEKRRLVGLREEGIRQTFLDPADARRLRYAGHTPPAGSVISSTDDEEGDETRSEVGPKAPVPPALAATDYEDDGDIPLTGQLSLPADDKTPRSEMFLAALNSRLDKASRTDEAPGASGAASVTPSDTDGGISGGQRSTGGVAAAASGENDEHDDTATTPKANPAAPSHGGNDGEQGPPGQT